MTGVLNPWARVCETAKRTKISLCGFQGKDELYCLWYRSLLISSVNDTNESVMKLPLPVLGLCLHG